MRRAIIKLTNTCQMRCIYCVNADGAEKLSKISFSTIRGILQRFKPKEIEFTGGEPTFYFDLLIQVVKEAKKFSSFVMINSNLELLSEEKIRQLELAGLSHVHLALHTLDRELHKIIRGNPRADLNQVLKMVDFILKKSGLRLIFEFVPMKINLQELPKVYRYVLAKKRKYGERIAAMEIGRLIPKGRASPQMAPSLKQEIAMFESLGKPCLPVKFFCYGPTVSKRLVKCGFQIFPCDAGGKMFYFDTKGRVLADNFSGVILSDNYQNFDLKKKPDFFCPYLAS